MRQFMFTVLATFVVAIGVAAQAPVVVRGAYLQQGTSTSIIIRWRTDVPCDSVVNYGSAPGSLFANVSDPTLTTEHTLKIMGLTADTKVFYSLATTGFGVLAGDDANHFFQTAPPAGTPKDTRLWILGDSGTGNANARSVRDAYYQFTGARHTDLMLMLGDNAYNQGTDSQYQLAMFQNMYEDMLRNTVVWPAYGNHDAISANASTLSGPYFDIFELPQSGEAGGLASGTEAYYSFDYGDIHFVVLDSQESDRSVGGAMATWLTADLAANTSNWTIVYFHHPPYSKGSHDSDTETRLVDMRQNFLPIIENEGVDLVLSGHSHAYERSYLLSGHYGLSNTFNLATHAVSPSDGRIGLGGAYQKRQSANGNFDGCVYAVAGASGKISGGSFDHPTSVISVPILGSLVVDINGSQLDARYIDSNGFLTDFFSITKNGVTPIQTTHLPVLPAQSWRFEDSGTDLGSAWLQPGFDDSAWAAGISPLGYGEPWIGTTTSFGPDPLNKRQTTYLRRDFFVDLDANNVESMVAGLLYDDGCVVYLNGVEVARSASMPPGSISYATYAASLHEAIGFELFDLAQAIPLLVRGINTLAVEVHQANPTSSDLVFDMALLINGQRSLLPPEAAGTVVSANGQLEDVFTINGSNGGFGRSVEVKVGEPFCFDIQAPSVLAGPAPFTIYGYTGTPSAADVYTLPLGIGPLLFPPAFPGVSAPLTFLVGDNLVGLPGALLFTNPAPWNAINPGLSFPATFTFHGWITTAPGQVRTFNAIRMHISP